MHSSMALALLGVLLGKSDICVLSGCFSLECNTGARRGWRLTKGQEEVLLLQQILTARNYVYKQSSLLFCGFSEDMASLASIFELDFIESNNRWRKYTSEWVSAAYASVNGGC